MILVNKKKVPHVVIQIRTYFPEKAQYVGSNQVTIYETTAEEVKAVVMKALQEASEVKYD